MMRRRCISCDRQRLALILSNKLDYGDPYESSPLLANSSPMNAGCSAKLGEKKPSQRSCEKAAGNHRGRCALQQGRAAATVGGTAGGFGYARLAAMPGR